MSNIDGFVRVAAVSPRVFPASCVKNADEIVSQLNIAAESGVQIAVLPELSVTGSSIKALFNQSSILAEAQCAVKHILSQTSSSDLLFSVGAPIFIRNGVYNCALVCQKGKIMAIVPKQVLSRAEAKYFHPASHLSVCYFDYAGQEDIPVGEDVLVEAAGATIALAFASELSAIVPPSSYAAAAGAQLLLCPAALPSSTGSAEALELQLLAHSSRTASACVVAACGYGESTGDFVYDGLACVVELGCCEAKSERFARKSHQCICDVDLDKINAAKMQLEQVDMLPEYRYIVAEDIASPDFSCLKKSVDPSPFLPAGLSEKQRDDRLAEAFEIQTAALCTRLEHIGCRKVVLGVSGGLDSTLALLVCVNAFEKLGLDRKGIIGISMPGFGTSKRTHSNSDQLMHQLGIDSREISIVPAVRQHFSDIGHDEHIADLTYENSQARERTQILMDVAGKEGAIVVGTGDLSEIALGWCTYNGDHMSMYGVNAGLPKTLIQSVVLWAARTLFADLASLAAVLEDIVDTPISPELIPTDSDGQIAQKTEGAVGPYELQDFFLYNYVKWGYSKEKLCLLASNAFGGKYDVETIDKWASVFMKRFHSQQFKRSCSPDAPMVTEISLSPREGYIIPSDLKL